MLDLTIDEIRRLTEAMAEVNDALVALARMLDRPRNDPFVSLARRVREPELLA